MAQPIVLWCMRKSKNETLGVSPLMTVMGRNPAKALKILRHLVWRKTITTNNGKICF